MRNVLEAYLMKERKNNKEMRNSIRSQEDQREKKRKKEKQYGKVGEKKRKYSPALSFKCHRFLIYESATIKINKRYKGIGRNSIENEEGHGEAEKDNWIRNENIKAEVP